MFDQQILTRSNGISHAQIIPVPNQHKDIEQAVSQILESIAGEDTSRQGLVGAPNRIARMYDEALGG
jgi:GTP cyclohydrolase I